MGAIGRLKAIVRTNSRHSPSGRPSQSPGATEPGQCHHGGQNHAVIHLEQGFRGPPINTGTMSDLQTLAATLLANFATVRIPRCDSLWISSVPDPSPKHRYRSLARALAGENLHHELPSSAPPISTAGAGPSRLLRPDRGRWTRWMAAAFLLPRSGRPSAYLMTSAVGDAARQCRDIRSRAVRHAPASANWSVRGV